MINSIPPPPPVSAEPAELVSHLAVDMAAAWRRGERPSAESYLDRYPELSDHPEEAIRLVYDEYCLRLELGEEASPDELLQRFPAWAKELEILLDCHRLVEEQFASPEFPGVGETLGDFRLVAELGRGTHGHVFLATQPALADRPVVLKVTPRRAREHLSLAHLQHTHIIPLHAMYDFPKRDLRAMCMPYLGGASLAQVLDLLREFPAPQRRGRSLLDALDSAQRDGLFRLPSQGGYRQVFAGASYVEAICHIGICLAEGLHYAHKRGLIHLDLKPSNVLLAADAQPLLLDFHLALEPLPAGEPAPDWFGGTPEYMSPEQDQACAAAHRGRPLPLGVDERSDLYSLGRLLYVALAGDGPAAERPLPALHRINPQVSVGLSDMIHKCLASNPVDRYPSALALANDLRRHLADQPLKGVPNRGWGERWQKWRRRRPNAPLWVGLLLALVAAGAMLCAAGVDHYRKIQRVLLQGHDQPQPETHLDAGHEQVALGQALLDAGDLDRAARELERATDQCPQDFWANFYRGVCAYRRKVYAEAVHSFGVAIALAPNSPECYYNRALAYAAQDDSTHALHDYDRTLELAPHLAAALLNRGILHYEAGRYALAKADLEHALQEGADPATVDYNLALVHRAQGESATARQHVEQALTKNPAHAEARLLQEQLRRSQ